MPMQQLRYMCMLGPFSAPCSLLASRSSCPHRPVRQATFTAVMKTSLNQKGVRGPSRAATSPAAFSSRHTAPCLHPHALAVLSMLWGQPSAPGQISGPQQSCCRNVRQCQRTVLTAASADDSQRGSSLMETAAKDELIDRLLACRSEQELARVVAENIVTVDAKFWLRVAARNDMTSSSDDKEKLRVMAERVMLLVNTVLEKTEQQLSESAGLLREIIAAAADEAGEWYLPLTAAQVAAVRAALDNHGDRLDEALLSNAFAWIRKCMEDRFDSMVQLIQKVLQLYAAKTLQTAETDGVEGALNQIVFAEEAEWGPLVKKFASDGTFSEPQFMEALQRRMEATVLQMQSGSYAQRVQAEYLKEVEGRARSVFKELAASS